MTASTEHHEAGEVGVGRPGGGSPDADLATIFPEPGRLVIQGIPAQVRRLGTREIMTGIRILVNEMGSGITELDLTALTERPDPEDPGAAAELAEQRQNLLGFLLVAAPNAADEILKLLAGLVEPQDPRDTKQIKEIMGNPPPTVALDVLAVVWAQEHDDLTDLVGKARQFLGYAQALHRTSRAGT